MKRILFILVILCNLCVANAQKLNLKGTSWNEKLNDNAIVRVGPIVGTIKDRKWIFNDNGTLTLTGTMHVQIPIAGYLVWGDMWQKRIDSKWEVRGDSLIITAIPLQDDITDFKNLDLSEFTEAQKKQIRESIPKLKQQAIAEVKADWQAKMVGKKFFYKILPSTPNQMPLMLDFHLYVLERKEKWSAVGDFGEGLAIVKDASGKYGYIDKTGKVVIPCRWESAGSFSEGLAGVKDANGKWGNVDKTGKVVIPCQWEAANLFSEGLTRVKDANGKLVYIDKTGKVVIPCQWEDIWSFREGLAVVKDANGKYGYIDKTGKVAIPCQWEGAWPFSDGLAKVKDANGKWGYIDKTGKIVIPCQWEASNSFSEGLARLLYDYIDKTGKVLDRFE